MSQKNRRIVPIILFLSLVIAVLGQYYLSRKQNLMWDGLFMYLVAMLLFGYVAARLEAKPRAERKPSTWNLWQQFYGLMHFNPIRLGALLLGLLLGFYAALTADARGTAVACWDLIVLWVAGMGLTAGAFVNWRALPKHIAHAGREFIRNPEWVLVLVLAITTFLLRAVALENIPYVLSGDEASMGLEARDVLTGVSKNPFVTGWLSHPRLYFFIQAAFLKVFGTTTAALRLSSACISAAIVVLLYLFARQYYGRLVAVVASVFFTGYHFAIHYGRLAANNIWDPFFALGAFFFIFRGLETKRLGYLALGGTILGLAVYFYMGARLIPCLLLAYILYWALVEHKFLPEHFSHLIVVFLGALVAALPMLAFFRTHMNDMMARWNLMGIFPSGWVDAQMAETGKSALAVVWGQFLKAALAYNFYPDPTYWYHPGIPLFEFLPSIFFVFGLIYAIRHLRDRRYLLLVLWYLAVVIFGGALLENPPSSFRLVLSIPAAVILMAVGVVKVLTLVCNVLGQPRVRATVVAVLLAVVMSCQSAYFYLAKYTPAHEFGGLNTEVADRMGRYLGALGSDYRCYFRGAPRMYSGFATIPFLAPDVVVVDTPEITGDLSFIQPDYNAVIVLLPEYRSELDIVERVYSGRLREFRDTNGNILFVSYEIDLV